MSDPTNPGKRRDRLPPSPWETINGLDRLFQQHTPNPYHRALMAQALGRIKGTPGAPNRGGRKRTPGNTGAFVPTVKLDPSQVRFRIKPQPARKPPARTPRRPAR